MSEQDLKPVVLKKDQPKPKAHNIQTTQKPIKTDEDDNIIKIKKVSKSMANSVQTARLAKKLSQDDLAKQSNLLKKVVCDIEKGGCIYNAQHFNMLSKALGVTIDRNVDIIEKK
jgi:ribosome-binding protein aMBF1 (putative translation factor)